MRRTGLQARQHRLSWLQGHDIGIKGKLRLSGTVFSAFQAGSAVIIWWTAAGARTKKKNVRHPHTKAVMQLQAWSPSGRLQRVHVLPDVDALGQSKYPEAVGIFLDRHHVHVCHFCAPFPLYLGQFSPCAGTPGAACPGTRLVHQHSCKAYPARPPIPLFHCHVRHSIG